jgi:exopolyphosphatase/guanosine-5'-triphosphate,3'-diphosphate pyrophosphatase
VSAHADPAGASSAPGSRVRAAIVDIGTNSTRLYIADVREGRIVRELVRRTTVTRLGAGVDASGRLHPDSMQRVYDTVKEYRRQIDEHQTGTAIAVLTSAVRDAANGRAFADELESRFAIAPHILSGDEEAALTFLGATSEHDPGDSTQILVSDIGGGSTELIAGRGREADFHVSTQAGVVRQSERHIHSDPPTDEELRELAADAREILEAAVPEDVRRSVRHGISVAGTPTSLAAIAQRLDPYDPARVQGYVLTVTECEEQLTRLASMPLERRRQVTGLHPDRAPTIVAGVVILLEVLRLFDLQAVEVSEHDILRGAALGLGAR